MRPDQVARLAELSERLADDVLAEADPRNWPGEGVPFEEWNKLIRGDRYWMKKNAAASLALLVRVEQLREEKAERKPTDPRGDLDKDIARAERLAREALERVGAASRGDNAK